MQIDIWSDIACPWCYIGKRRFEKALAQFPHKDDITVTWHSFQLDPQAPQRSSVSQRAIMQQKFGRSASQVDQIISQMTEMAAGEGLDFRFDDIKGANTFTGHELVHFAAAHDKQGEMKERLMHAYWTEGLPLWDTDTLVKLASEVGLDADEARTALEQHSYADGVHADIQQAEAYGIDGVPFFVIDEKYGISGAQSPETFLSALKQAWSASHPLVTLGSTASSEKNGEGPNCEGGACSI